MYSASQTAFSTFSDPLLESANVRKFQLMLLVTLAFALMVICLFNGI